jgi:hypothetical protein
VAISVPCLVLSTVLLSETFFLALLLLMLPALEQLVADDSQSDRLPIIARRGAFLCGLLIGGVTLVRSYGVALLPAILLPLAVQRRWRDSALVAASALLSIVPWQVWAARHGGVVPAPLLGTYDSYSGWWIRGARSMGTAIFPRTLGMTVPEATNMLVVLFSPVHGTVARWVTLLALGALTIAGVVANWRRVPVTLLFLVGYLAIVILWPGPPARFIWGVWPIVLAVLLLGARSGFAAGASWRTPARLVLGAAFCWIGAGYVAYEARAIRGRWWASIPRAAESRIGFSVGWTQANTAPDAIVATDDEAAVYLYSGRQTLPVWSFTVQRNFGDERAEVMAAEGLAPLLDAYPVRAVIVTSRTSDAIANQLASGPDPRLVLSGEYASGRAYLVRRR